MQLEDRFWFFSPLKMPEYAGWPTRYILTCLPLCSEYFARCCFENKRRQKQQKCYGFLLPNLWHTNVLSCEWMALLNDKWWIQRQGVFLILAVSISSSPSTSGGDLRNLFFHCNPRGIGAFYYLFFSSPASSLPSHFLTLIILQSVSCFFLIPSHTMISYLGLHVFICLSRKSRQTVDNYVTYMYIWVFVCLTL